MSFPKTTALILAPPDPLPEDVTALFAKCQEKLGLVLNVLVAYAHNPDKLRAFSLMYNTLMLGRSGLSKLEREMIAVAVSALNRCWYCLVAHGAAVRVLFGSPELGEALVMNHQYTDITPRQHTMIEFARKMTTGSAVIGEVERDALRGHGFTDANIWDIAETAAFFNMSNRLTSAIAMVPNPEYHGQGRGS